MTPTELGLGPILQKAPLTGLTLLAVTIACWVFFLTGAGTGMDVWEMSVLSLPPIGDQYQEMGETSTSDVLSMLFMWWTMMLAMMMPGAFRDLPAYRHRDYSPASTLFQFWISYAGTWLVFSVIATGLQYLLIDGGLLHAMKMWSANISLSAGLLMFAGLYQFSAIKSHSLVACHDLHTRRSPFENGAHYGFNCCVSSFPLMLLLFVGGVMNFYLVVLLTALVTVEKSMSHSKPLSFVIGFACIGGSALVLIG